MVKIYDKITGKIKNIFFLDENHSEMPNTIILILMLITIIIKENVTDRQDRETKALPTTHNYTRVQCTL